MHIATNEVIVINFNCQVSFLGDTLSAARSRDLLQIYGQCRLADVIQVSDKLGVESCLYHRRKRFMQRAFWLGNDNKLIFKKRSSASSFKKCALHSRIHDFLWPCLV